MTSRKHAVVVERLEPEDGRSRYARPIDEIFPARLLWNVGWGESVRIYRGGYADLKRLTGLSKRGIQNVMGELQRKQVIRIHQKPGYHRTETSAYEVPDSAAVIEIWRSHGWRHSLGKSKTLTD
jgi:hypothetical protein